MTEPKLVWSTNGEDFLYEDREEAMACADAGETVFVGEAFPVRVDAGALADRIFEWAADQAFNQCGQYAEEMPEAPTDAAIEELRGWLDRHLHSRISIFGVRNIREDGVAPDA